MLWARTLRAGHLRVVGGMADDREGAGGARGVTLSLENPGRRAGARQRDAGGGARGMEGESVDWRSEETVTLVELIVSVFRRPITWFDLAMARTLQVQRIAEEEFICGRCSPPADAELGVFLDDVATWRFPWTKSR